MLEKVRKVGLYYFIGKKSSESWTLSFLLAENITDHFFGLAHTLQ
jgi:hypothetical protein